MKVWKIIVSSYHVTYAFQSESALCSCLNVEEVLAQNQHNIRSLSNCKRTWTHNHFVRKRTLNHLAKLACNVNQEPSNFSTFDSIFFSTIKVRALIIENASENTKKAKEKQLSETANPVKQHLEAVTRSCSAKKVSYKFRKIQRKAPVPESFFFRPEASNFIKKESLAQVFSCEFCEFCKNIFLYETPPVVASAWSLCCFKCHSWENCKLEKFKWEDP